MSAARQRWLSTLVVIEMSLAVVLLVGAGLFTSSFATVSRIDLGIDYDRVLAVHVVPKVEKSSPDGLNVALMRLQNLGSDVVTRVGEVPGVERAAAFSGGLPLSGSYYRSGVNVGPTEFRGDDSVDVHRVTPEYLAVIGVPVIGGRGLMASDNVAGAGPVVVLNEAAARRYFAGATPLGAHMAINNNVFTVVGIAKDVRLGGPEAGMRPEAYIGLAASRLNTTYGAYVVVKTAGDPSAIVNNVKSAIWSAAPDFTIPEAMTLTDHLARLVAQRKFNMLLVGLFSSLALVIASVGLSGVLAFSVEQRRQEIGVRMALGADRGAVVWLVIRRAGALMVVGVATGVSLSWWSSRWLGQFLFRIDPHDTRVYALVIFVLFAAGLLAASVPARRASGIDPLQALRSE